MGMMDYYKGLLGMDTTENPWQDIQYRTPEQNYGLSEYKKEAERLANPDTSKEAAAFQRARDLARQRGSLAASKIPGSITQNLSNRFRGGVSSSLEQELTRNALDASELNIQGQENQYDQAYNQLLDELSQRRVGMLQNLANGLGGPERQVNYINRGTSSSAADFGNSVRKWAQFGIGAAGSAMGGSPPAAAPGSPGSASQAPQAAGPTYDPWNTGWQASNPPASPRPSSRSSASYYGSGMPDQYDPYAYGAA